MPRSTQTQSEAKNGLNTHIIAGILVGIVGVYIGYNMIIDYSSILLGVIFIIVGILSPVLGYSMGQNQISGNCPYCGHNLLSYKTSQSTKCKACRQRVIIRDNRYWTIN